MISPNKQPWIHSASFDLSLILGPPIFASLVVILFRRQIESHHAMGPLAWLILVVCIDVAHVYSSLFRTYFDSSLQNRGLLWAVPLLCWVIGALLYSTSPAWFWTGLAYIAVFHFIRQQFGFAMIYSRESYSPFFRRVDRITIYVATLYPLVFWHSHLPRNFNWFVEGDFLDISTPQLSHLFGWVYISILFIYFIKELYLKIYCGSFNIPRNLIVFGTAISWYLGIVWFNNDLTFTLTNVVSHGIPYVALIWLYGRKSRSTKEIKFLGKGIFRIRMIPIYLGILLVLAYFEEGLWAGFIWRDHLSFFPNFASLPVIHDSMLLALLIPLLALPQATHYIFDAFLWRSKGIDSGWKEVLLELKESKR